jgi:hypothetical protein
MSRMTTLCHNVGKLLTTRNVKHAQLSNGDAFTDEVDVDFDVLHQMMMYMVAGHVDCRDIVTEHH